ncbi:MAG: NUDIX hydrolase [Sphingobacteriales bacterium]|jgi:8-oxo-dGTP pyrophosphatase MutT (NUDIX family)|nr:NUDIX hydrolase [Sphingobacteriales bacterium]OJW03670.1 MAG: DNA mismatch repair protein MutT [Sphingobacteriales bacterium 44-61]
MSETNPWQVLAARQMYDNNWIQVTEYDVINPNGGKGIYGKVHFKNIAIGVVVLDEQMNTYLVGQFRFPLGEYSWEIPEGGGSLNIDPLDSAKRELLEETGLVANNWQLILKMHLSNSVSDEYALLYLARGLEQHAPMPEETEQLVVKKIPLEEAWQMVQQSRITDSMSVAAIQQVKLMLLAGQI